MADGSMITFSLGTTGGSWQTAGTMATPTPQRGENTTMSRSWAQPERTELEQARMQPHLMLQDVAVAATLATERALSYVEAMEEALAILEQAMSVPAAGTPAPPLPSAIASLSPREREVLRLVTAGQTNKAIAENLYVSTNTVKTHIASLLRKLRADSRAQLAAIAARHGLA